MPRDKSWDRGRKPQRKRPARRILILCEDTKSSRDYLAGFRPASDQVEVQCVGTGMSNDKLMEDAIKRTKAAQEERAPYEHVWVVFDRDSSPSASQHQFERSFELARAYGNITACWSNDAFELWYLLHFNYHNTPIHRKEINSKLGKLLPGKYDKADASYYGLLLPRLPDAMRNALQLEFAHSEQADPKGNPSTCVHHLVRALIDLDPKKQQNGMDSD